MNHPLSDFLPVKPADTVILDTDICTDCDDCGALAVLFYYCKKNNIKIGAVINDIDNLYGCGAIDAIASYYGMEVSIGMTTDKGFQSEPESRYSRQISEQFSENFRNGTLTVRPALDLYREVLQNAAEKSVVIITVGLLRQRFLQQSRSFLLPKYAVLFPWQVILQTLRIRNLILPCRFLLRRLFIIIVLCRYISMASRSVSASRPVLRNWILKIPFLLPMNCTIMDTMPALTLRQWILHSVVSAMTGPFLNLSVYR